MVAGNQQFVLTFLADTAQMESSLRGFTGNARSLINEVQTAAARPLRVSAQTSAQLSVGDLRGAAAGLGPALSQRQQDITAAATRGGASPAQAARLGQQAVSEAATQLAREYNLTTAQQTRLQRLLSQEVGARIAQVQTIQSTAAARAIEREQIRTSVVRERAASEDALRAKARRIVAEQQEAEALRRLTREEARLAGLRGAEARAALARASASGAAGGVGGGGIRGGIDNLRGGLRSVLRFAIPSALLFGTARGISAIVEESERLEQINVRLAGQFRNLGQLGTFDTVITDIGLAVNEANRASVAAAQLDIFRESLEGISTQTGVAADEIFELGGAFVGFFTSLEGSQDGLVGFAEEATEIAAQFSVITGLSPEEAFNDLSAAVRVFSEGDGAQFNAQLEQLSDNLISVADSSGIAANELADFVGRIAPIAQTAGFAAEEVAAIGGALLQASGLGGAQLAEQFGRIISTFGDGLDEELADLAVSVPDIGLNLDDIFRGETRAVLFQLIDGFDALSDAQQRQVIASIGSRREGNTLATLLTNQQAVVQGLASQQDNAGAAAERFATVSETLTVRFNQLQVQFQQLGLALLEGGLGDILQDLIGIIGAFAEILDDVLLPAIRVFAEIIERIPPELAPLGVALLVANRAIGGFGVALTNVNNQLRGQSLSVGIRAIGQNSVQSAREVGLLTASFRGLLGAASLVGVALTAFNAFQAITSSGTDDSAQRQERLNQTLREAGNEYVSIADRARAYNEELERTAELQERTLGDGSGAGGLDVGAAAAAASAGLGEGIRQIAGERDALGEFTTLIQESGLTLNELAGAAIESAPEINNLVGRFNDLADAATTADNRASGAIGGLNAEFGNRDLSDNTRALVQGLRALALDSENGFQQVQTVTEILQALAGDNDQLIQNAALDVGIALSQLAEQATTSDAVRAEIDALFAQQAALGGAQGDLALIIGAGDILPEVGDDAERARQQAQQEFAQEVSTGLADLAQVRAQFEAGVVTQTEFNTAASDAVALLREQLASAQGAGENAEQAARIIGEIADIEQQLAEDAVARFEADQEIIELLGGETGAVEDLLGLALDPVIQRSPAEFRSAVTELINAEQEIAFEAASRAGTAEEAAQILADFELSGEAQQLFVETQLRSEAGALIVQVAQAAGQDIDETFDLITQEVQVGRDLEEILRQILLDEIAEIEALLQTADPFAIDALAAQLGQLRAQLEGLGGADIPTIIGGDEVGAGTADEIASAVDQLNDQYERVLEGINNDAQILRAFGLDRTPDALAAEAAQLTNLLSDPGFTDQEARFEAAVQLAGVLQAIAQLQGDELAAANEALALLTGATNPEQLVTAEAVFNGIVNQSSAFGVFLNTYLDVGEDVLNILGRSISELVAGGAEAADALRRALEEQIAQLNTTIFVGGFGGSSESLQPFIDLRNQLQEQLNGLDAQNVPDIDIGGIEVPDVVPNPGATNNNAEDQARALAEAQFALLRAQFALDPVELARIAQQEAAFALSQAETAAERIQARADEINADRQLAQAIQDVFNAQTELAISLAEIAGDTEGALQLAVDQAEAELEFLRSQGAGEAAIADAERRLAEAQERQFEGLIEDQLGDLDFLFQIGELTTQQFIAQLETILAGLDPIADEDLFREITLQIQDLRNRTNDLSLNLGEFEVPSLFEVRRLALTGFGGTPDQAGPGGSVDNRNINIQMNISDGVSWEDAIEVIQDALGTDSPVTFETRVY